MSKWAPSSSTKGFALAARFMIEEKCGGAVQRIVILIDNYCSGKAEIVMNMAVLGQAGT